MIDCCSLISLYEIISEPWKHVSGRSPTCKTNSGQGLAQRYYIAQIPFNSPVLKGGENDFDGCRTELVQEVPIFWRLS